MTNGSKINCPICNGTLFTNLFTCRDHFKTNETFDICQCHNCGLQITTPLPKRDKIAEYYKTETYISHTNTKKGLINKIYHIVRDYMLYRKVKIVEREQPLKGKLLDVGTGIGLFPREMKKKGWSVQAIETSESARSYASRNYNLIINTEELWESLNDKSVDVITLWHVLEHIPNINTIWRNFNRVLKDKGSLIIAVPNNQSYDALYYKENWAAYDVPRHAWHFNTETITKLANKHEFAIKRIYPMPFDAFYISMLSEKNKKSKLFVLKGFAQGFLGGLKSINNIENSSSLIYILNKVEK